MKSKKKTIKIISRFIIIFSLILILYNFDDGKNSFIYEYPSVIAVIASIIILKNKTNDNSLYKRASELFFLAFIFHLFSKIYFNTSLIVNINFILCFLNGMFLREK